VTTSSLLKTATRLAAVALTLQWLGVPAAAQEAAPAQPARGNGGFVEGRDYLTLPRQQPTSEQMKSGQVEVAEVFMYGCPGCFELEPHLEKWLGAKPDYIHFVRLPAVWNGLAELHARAYYTAQILGKNAAIDGPFFNEIHVKGNMLDSVDLLTALFARFGVTEKAFRDTFYSPAVDEDMSHADDLVTRYRVGMTPTVVVNGKYLTSGTMAGTYARWFAIIESLAASEHMAPAGAAH
jgi:protein dithiol oxidoreductase (disulfide-forming)